jgi:hypothetical protein
VSAPQFTPGPWQSKHAYTKEGACTIIANVDGDQHADGTTTYSYDFICTCEDEFGEYNERATANARLIAAAPELYEALNKCRAIIKFHVKPEKCVSDGDGVISARDAFESAVMALAKARGEA